MRHALTVDVEEYFHVSAFAKSIGVEEWDNWPTRVEHSTSLLLDMFAEDQTKATFFVLGWVAQRYPELIKSIHAAGHEIACHGMSHQLIYNQKQAVFTQETKDSKALLEDIIGDKVNGYRAASYSITPQSLWALDTLVEAGFSYDSSIFPVFHDRYGMPGAPFNIHTAKAPNGGEITEFPLTSAPFAGNRLPAAGGGYFRFYPYPLTKYLLKKAVAEISQPFVFYLHPWEVDPDQPRVKDLSLLSRFRHYLNLTKCQNRLQKLMADFPFGTMSDLIVDYTNSKSIDVFDYAKLKR